MNGSTSNNGFQINAENLKKCFEIVNQKSSQNQQVLSDVQKYIENCKSDPQFPAILIQIFDNENENLNIRFVALIEFKNLMKENWAIKRGSKVTSIYSEQFKNEVRALLITYLDKYQDKLFRKQVNDILRTVAAIDFPAHYPGLAEYFLNNMGSLKEVIKDDQMLLSDLTFNFVRTLKVVMGDRSRKKGDSKSLFYNVYLKLMEGFHEFWDYLHTNTQRFIGAYDGNNLDQIEKFIKLTRKADKIYISFLCSGCDEMMENSDILKITNLLVQRAADITENTKNIKEANNLNDLLQEYSKNLYKYIYMLSQLQVVFPWIFKDVIVDSLRLVEYIIDNPQNFGSEYVLRSALIWLTYSLRRYSFQTENPHKKPHIASYDQIRNECTSAFCNFFNKEKIEAFFNIFLVKLLPERPFLKSNQDPDNLDDFVEIENDQFASEFEKLETPLYNLTLKCTLEFLQRFSEHSISLVHAITTKLLQNELQGIAPIIQDGIFAMVGQLPPVYQSYKLDASQYLDLGSVLKYLEENSADLNLSKRIPVLIHKWIGLFDANAKVQIVQNIVNITQTLQNHVVRYECCMCLKVILKDEKEGMPIDYASLSESLLPIVIDLLGRFKNPQAVWGLLELLKALFTNAQYSTQNDNIIAQLQSQNILALTKSEELFLITALADMFKTVIASFPFGTQLTSMFMICIEFIDYHFKVGRFKTTLDSLWLFLIREYSETQNVGDALQALFSRYSGLFLNMQDPDELGKFINIIEEYILAGFITPENYGDIIKIMEEKYALTMEDDEADESEYNLRSAILSLMSTLILIVLNQGSVDNLKVFNTLFKFLLSDLLNNTSHFEYKSFRAVKVSMLTVLNRFIISNLEAFLNFLNELQIGLDNFMEGWIRNMDYLSSPQVKRINAVAIFQLVSYIKDKQLFAKYFVAFVKYTYPEVIYAIQTGNKPQNEQKLSGTTERCKDVRDSERKKVSRQNGLYYEIDLKELCNKSFKDAIEGNGFTLEEIGLLLNDQNAFDSFMQLLNS